MARIILCTKPVEGEKYSIESGIADNIYHYDHHGEYCMYPSPCNNEKICMKDNDLLKEDTIIRITHFDADTYIGVLRLLNLNLPSVDLAEIERIDCNGSKGCGLENKALCYMEGVDAYMSHIGFPQVSDEPMDVTDYFYDLYKEKLDNILEIGVLEVRNQLKGTEDSLYERSGNLALYSVKKGASFNPSMCYKDGVEIVVVYYERFRCVSLYCDPDRRYNVGGRYIGDIYFEGHPKACGSPRGVEYKYSDAVEVYNTLCNMFYVHDNNMYGVFNVMVDESNRDGVLGWEVLSLNIDESKKIGTAKVKICDTGDYMDFVWDTYLQMWLPCE